MKKQYVGGKHYLINPHKETRFKDRWGISAYDLARVEGVTPDAINMRVMKYGTPFQRRAKLTLHEEKYGRTVGEIALEQGVHPNTIHMRERTFGTYKLPEDSNPRYDLRDDSWVNDPKYKRMLASTFFTLEWALEQLERINWATR